MTSTLLVRARKVCHHKFPPSVPFRWAPFSSPPKRLVSLMISLSSWRPFAFSASRAASHNARSGFPFLPRAVLDSPVLPNLVNPNCGPTPKFFQARNSLARVSLKLKRTEIIPAMRKAFVIEGNSLIRRVLRLPFFSP